MDGNGRSHPMRNKSGGAKQTVDHFVYMLIVNNQDKGIDKLKENQSLGL